MPRVSYLNTTENRIEASRRSCEAVAVLLKGTAGNALQLSKILGISPNTAQRRLKNPTQFTLEDLIRAGVELDIPCEELIGKIRWKVNGNKEETA